MKQHKILINNIPSIVFGEPSDKVFIYIHGKMSRKEYAESFALIAEKYGYQTVSFDLPEHGERTDKAYRCDVWNGIKDLTAIADYVYDKWSNVSLFACSLGAYFSLNAYADRSFGKIMFQSPIVDMQWLVEHIMLWSNVTAEMLEEKKEIDNPIDTLRWDYFLYIKNHPVTSWHKGTNILYGSLDELQPYESIADFANRFEAKVTVSENSKHPFMEEKDFSATQNWITDILKE